jgi:hypothetical protein
VQIHSTSSFVRLDPSAGKYMLSSALNALKVYDTPPRVDKEGDEQSECHDNEADHEHHNLHCWVLTTVQTCIETGRPATCVHTHKWTHTHGHMHHAHTLAPHWAGPAIASQSTFMCNALRAHDVLALGPEWRVRRVNNDPSLGVIVKFEAWIHCVMIRHLHTQNTHAAG